MVRDRRIFSLATVVGMNWNTFALWRDMSEMLLCEKTRDSSAKPESLSL